MGKEEQPKRITPAEVIRSDEALQQALGISIQPEFRVGFKVSIFNAEMRQKREALGLTQRQLSQRLQERGIKCGLHTAG